MCRDVIEICDDDYAGISIGGRVLAVTARPVER